MVEFMWERFFKATRCVQAYNPSLNLATVTKRENCWGEKVSRGRDETRERVWILINLNRCQGIDRQDVSIPSQEISEASCQLNLDHPRHILSLELWIWILPHIHQTYLVNLTWTTPGISCQLNLDHCQTHIRYTLSIVLFEEGTKTHQIYFLAWLMYFF